MDREYVGIRQATQKAISNVRLEELRISHTQQVNYGAEECKAAAMYALHLHPKAWGFVVLKELFGGGRTVCSIATISRKGVQKWQR